jgi:myosin heavy subunit
MSSASPKPRNQLASMSTERATGNQSTGLTNEELSDQLTRLKRRCEALEAEKERVEDELQSELEDVRSELEATREQQQEDRHALARENHELRASHEQLAERVEEAEAERDELRERIDRADASRGHIIEDIVDVEEQLTEVEAGSAGSKGGDDTAETTAQQSEMTPIERISKMDAEDTGIDMTPSIERAVSMFDHWHEWSQKTPKGRVLKDGLKTLLRTATGESLAWRQVYRACEALEELSKGRIEFIHHSRHGKMLIESAPAGSGDCHSSSADTG